MFLAEAVDLLSRLDNSPFNFDETIAFCEPPKKPGKLRSKGLLVGRVSGAGREDLPAAKAWLKKLLPILKVAQPFRFDRIPGLDGDTSRDLPAPDKQGVDLFNSGAVRPPFPVCWFEVEMPEDGEEISFRLGFLVETDGGEVRIHTLQRHEIEEGTLITFRFYAMTLERSLGGGRDLGFGVVDPAGAFAREVREAVADGDTADDYAALMAGATSFCVYLVLILGSNRKIVETVRPGAIERRRRSDKGLSPLKDLRVVTMPADWRPGEMQFGLAPPLPRARRVGLAGRLANWLAARASNP